MLAQILRDMWVAQDGVDMARLIKAFIEQKFELCGVFHADAVCDFALQKGGVGA